MRQLIWFWIEKTYYIEQGNLMILYLFNPSLLSKSSPLVIFLILFFITQGCGALPQKTVYSNIKETTTESKYGLIEHRGMQFWLQSGEREPVDRLELAPGRYMIGFIVRRTNRGGAGCVISNREKNMDLKYEEQYLPFWPLCPNWSLHSHR